jgi:signal transduction histidine kinase
VQISSPNLDFIFLIYGLSFLLLGAMCTTRGRRSKGGPAWAYLAAFGFLHGVNEWADMLALSFGDASVFKTIRLLLMAGSYLALIEFGRRGWLHNRTRLLGLWIYAPLLALAGAGSFAEMNGLNAACRYALGLTGGLFAAWTLWRASQHDEIGERSALRMTALAFLIYAPATGLIVPKASFFPASWLNQDVFVTTAGFPIQLVRALCALVAMAGVWLSSPQTDSPARRAGLSERCLIPTMFGMILIATWFTAEWRGQIVDAEMRERLLDQATAIARTINPEEVKILSFTAEDKTNPVFLRIRRQMIAYGHLIHQRSIYSLAIRNNSLVFGPENIAENDPWASPPGTIYEHPKPEDWGAFQSRNPYTTGPYTDEYGTFVSGLSPVLDPRTGEVLMLVGLDMAADQWASQIAVQRLVPILFALALTTILIVGSIALEWREPLPPGRRQWLQHSEVAMTLAFTLVLTLAGAFLAYESGAWSHRQMFSQLADAKAELLRTQMQSLGEDLANIAGFYLASDHVTRRQFHTFVSPLIKNTVAHAYVWVPRTAPAQKEKVEAEARLDGFEGFRIFQKNEHGEKVPNADHDVYYPVYFVEPPASKEFKLGFDLGSESIRRAEIEETEQIGLPMASVTVTLVQDTGPQDCVLVYQPVYLDPVPIQDGQSTVIGQRALHGFALAVLNVGSMLKWTLFPTEQDKSVASVALLQLTPEGEAKMLASYPGENFRGYAPGELHQDLGQSGLSTLRPLFAFGRAYAVVFDPGPGFLSSPPVRIGWAAGLIGLFLAIVTTLFVGFLRNRQAFLEKQVRTRTAELHEREEALEASEASLQGILRSTADGILAVGKDNRVLFANERFVEMWMIPQELVDSGDDSAMIQYVLDQLTDPQGFIEKVKRLYESEEEDFDTLFFKDGKVFDRGSRPLMQGQEILGRVWSFQDVTKRKRAEEEKEKLEVQLRHTHKMEAIGTLAGGIAHDFNNILAAIIGYTEMALTGVSTSSPTRHYLGQVLNASHRAKELVKQILASSRQTQAQERMTIEIAPLVEEALKLLRASLPTTIEIRPNIGSKKSVALADPTEVHQLLVNLCTNAAHAMEEKGGVLEISLSEVAIDSDAVAAPAGLKPGHYLRLTVSDTGRGIDPTILERIFDPYFTTKEVGKGSGLGLAVVHGIVKRHEGAITVNSEPGVGTSFHVYFPKVDSMAVKEVEELVEPLPGGTERILFVDDEEILVEMGKSVLEWLGYEVTVTTSSVEALELFRTQPDRFDTVITDYTMPHMTGADLAKEMIRLRPAIPIIMCTGFSERISEEKARDIGIRAFAMKPLNMRDLAETVREVLDKK